MKEKFKLRINHQTFEQSPVNRNTLEKTCEDGELYNVEEIRNLYIHFLEYAEEGGKSVGVKLRCDGISEPVLLKPGETFHFRYKGISVDNEGCPEDFIIEYDLMLEE